MAFLLLLYYGLYTSTDFAMASTLVLTLLMASILLLYCGLSVQGHDVERELVDVCFPKWSAVLALLGALASRSPRLRAEWSQPATTILVELIKVNGMWEDKEVEGEEEEAAAEAVAA